MSMDAPLPQNLEACQRELLAVRSTLMHTEAVLAETAVTCDHQQTQLSQLQEEREQLKRYLFGRRSERYVPDPRQGLLCLGDEGEAVAPLPPPSEEEITYRRRKGHGWSQLPKHLPRQEVLLDVPENERHWRGG
jgi:Transposase C of IS166 homeodomain